MEGCPSVICRNKTFIGKEAEKMSNCLVKIWNFEPTPNTGNHWPGLDEEKLRGSSLTPSLVHKAPSAICTLCAMRQVCGLTPFQRVLIVSCVWLFAALQTIAHQVLLPMGFPSNNNEMSCHFLLQGIFPTQGLNPHLPHYRQVLYGLNHQGSPIS